MFPARDRLEAYGTAKQRTENAAFLQRPFHVVIGNPPWVRLHHGATTAKARRHTRCRAPLPI